MAYPCGAVERAMKVQEVILRALSGQFTWLQAGRVGTPVARAPKDWMNRRGGATLSAGGWGTPMKKLAATSILGMTPLGASALPVHAGGATD